MEIDWCGEFPAAMRGEVERTTAVQRTLEDIVRWGLARTPPVLVSRVVAQDEFTHDVVLRHPLGPFIVYDCT